MAEEIFDIVDENGQPTGETVIRSQVHSKGITIFLMLAIEILRLPASTETK